MIAFISLTFGGIFLSGFSTMQGALTFKSSKKGQRGYNFGILVTCIGLAPLGLLYLSFLVNYFPVNILIQINTIFAILALLIIGYFVIKRKFVIF